MLPSMARLAGGGIVSESPGSAFTFIDLQTSRAIHLRAGSFNWSPAGNCMRLAPL